MKFSASNADFSSPSPDPIDLRMPGTRASKKDTTLKSGYLSLYTIFES